MQLKFGNSLVLIVTQVTDKNALGISFGDLRKVALLINNQTKMRLRSDNTLTGTAFKTNIGPGLTLTAVKIF